MAKISNTFSFFMMEIPTKFYFIILLFNRLGFLFTNSRRAIEKKSSGYGNLCFEFYLVLLPRKFQQN